MSLFVMLFFIPSTPIYIKKNHQDTHLSMKYVHAQKTNNNQMLIWFKVLHITDQNHVIITSDSYNCHTKNMIYFNADSEGPQAVENGLGGLGPKN